MIAWKFLAQEGSRRHQCPVVRQRWARGPVGLPGTGIHACCAGGPAVLVRRGAVEGRAVRFDLAEERQIVAGRGRLLARVEGWPSAPPSSPGPRGTTARGRRCAPGCRPHRGRGRSPRGAESGPIAEGSCRLGGRWKRRVRISLRRIRRRQCPRPLRVRCRERRGGRRLAGDDRERAAQVGHGSSPARAREGLIRERPFPRVYRVSVNWPEALSRVSVTGSDITCAR